MNKDAQDREGATPGTFGWRVVPTLIVLIAVLAAIGWFLVHQGIDRILVALAATPLVLVAISVGLNIAAIGALGAVEWVAVRYLYPDRVPAVTAIWTGFKGYAATNLTGFAVIVGAMVRLPIYRRYGLDAVATVGVMGLSWSAFWIASAMAIAVSLLLAAPGLISGLMAIGMTILVAVLGAWLGSNGQKFTVRSRSVSLPPARVIAVQALIACGELFLAGMSLWVLLPSEGTPSFGIFLAAYITAVGAGLLSHIPGGLGSFEAGLLLFAGIAPTTAVTASLILYRVARFLAPLLIALPSLVVTMKATPPRPSAERS
ncbi:hypothetical protein [Notoacmeibacter sp. MSK16QG-6]|uniref:hypothetical protein n=1 Tax=Notoacmeibacter sp. MSK16QG-6 TaxID=2957982 RepID=UPI00209D7906|nr:hypothetical protein [Notoacmeibacter sp. MSK16QG-6]MCP1200236.1 hypothetical protein [Notoacmeibacter sp. MSK16QG-6]